MYVNLYKNITEEMLEKIQKNNWHLFIDVQPLQHTSLIFASENATTSCS